MIGILTLVLISEQYMQTLEQFLQDGSSLVVYSAEAEIFRSDASDLTPLIEYVQTIGDRYAVVVIFDKYVGRAAALLMSLVKPSQVYVGVISEGGAAVLTEAGIAFEAAKQVTYLMDVASESMCRWEKLSLGKTAEEFRQVLKSEL